MKIVYNATNSLEAHMIRGLLEQQDIPAYVHGEHLQSGVGEIPTIGLVKVNVDDENYQAAKKIIQNWEKAESVHSKIHSDLEITNKSNSKNYPSMLVLCIGLIFGAVAMHLYLNSTPVKDSGIDYNLDGKNDEVWSYQNGLLIKVQSDLNFDKKFDAVATFEKGIIRHQEIDENFDGIFEKEDSYENGAIFFSKSDTNNDKKIDLTMEYETGSPKYKRTIFSLTNGLPKKTQYYIMNKLVSAEYDSNDDGEMDTIINYDDYEEEISKKPK